MTLVRTLYMTLAIPSMLTLLQLFTRRAASLLYTNQRLQRWCFDVELLYLADVLGIPSTEVCLHYPCWATLVQRAPCPPQVFVEWTEIPGSKIRPTSIISMAWELLTIKIAYTLGLWRVYSEAELALRDSKLT
jgi:dolichyl-phosphate beta-glucosyltransferase